MISVRRLGRGDEAILRYLAEHDPDFDIPDRTPTPTPLDALDDGQAAAYLADPTVLHWVALDAEDGTAGIGTGDGPQGDPEAGAVIGFLSCLLLRYRAQPARELLLYEIGVRRDRQRRGVGRTLMTEMTEWMDEHRVPEVWVGADNQGAEQFYAACGFAADVPATYMIMRRPWAT